MLRTTGISFSPMKLVVVGQMYLPSCKVLRAGVLIRSWYCLCEALSPRIAVVESLI